MHKIKEEEVESNEEKFGLFGMMVLSAIISILVFGVTLLLPYKGFIGLIRLLLCRLAVLIIGISGIYFTIKFLIAVIYDIDKRQFIFSIKRVCVNTGISIFVGVLTFACLAIGIEGTTNTVKDLITQKIEVNTANIITLEKKSHSRGGSSYSMKIQDIEKGDAKEFELNKSMYKKLKKEGVEFKRDVKISSYKNSDVIYSIE